MFIQPDEKIISILEKYNIEVGDATKNMLAEEILKNCAPYWHTIDNDYTEIPEIGERVVLLDKQGFMHVAILHYEDPKKTKEEWYDASNKEYWDSFNGYSWECPADGKDSYWIDYNQAEHWMRCILLPL